MSIAARLNRLPPTATHRRATVVAGIGLAVFAYATSDWMFMLAAAIWGFGSGISGPAPAAYVADLAPTETRARIFGFFRSTSDFGYIVGPLVLGWIAGQYGYHAPMLLTAGMIVISGALFWVFAPEFHRARREIGRAHV